VRPNNGVVPPRSSSTVVGNVLLLLDQPEFKKRLSLGSLSFCQLWWRTLGFLRILCSCSHDAGAEGGASGFAVQGQVLGAERGRQ